MSQNYSTSRETQRQDVLVVRLRRTLKKIKQQYERKDEIDKKLITYGKNNLHYTNHLSQSNVEG